MGGGTNPLEKFIGLEPPKPPPGKLTKEQEEKFKGTSGILGETARGGFFKDFLLPEPPDIGEEERARFRGIAERLRKASITGRGRAATIATGPRGVTAGAPIRRRTLRGV